MKRIIRMKSVRKGKQKQEDLEEVGHIMSKVKKKAKRGEEWKNKTINCAIGFLA